jgi:hypothetical protein
VTAPAGGAGGSYLPAALGLSVFQGYPVVRTLSSAGGEADILVIRDGEGREYVLRLYRQGKEPKAEVFGRLVELGGIMRGAICLTFRAGLDPPTGRFYEIQEYLSLGDLATYLSEGRFKEGDLVPLLKQLSEAVAGLHHNGMIHRDLKPDNILLRSRDPLVVAVADFGISSAFTPGISIKETRMANTPLYSAPESFADLAGTKGDYWSLGVILLEALLGKHPLKGASINKAMREITARGLAVPEGLSPDNELLLKGLLTRDDKRRWGKTEVARWLAGDREIPIYYEGARELTDSPQGRPYKFRGREYRSPGSLSEAFARGEEDWAQGREHLARGYVRDWLETTGRKEAALLMERLPEADPDLRLFAFIQFTRGNFQHFYKAAVLSRRNLIKLLKAASPSPGEAALIQEILQGRLASLPRVARAAGNPLDPELETLFALGRPFSQELALSALEASGSPEDFFVGLAPPLKSPVDALSFMLLSGTELLTIPYMEGRVPVGSVVPGELLKNLEEPATYAEGKRQLALLISSGAFQEDTREFFPSARPATVPWGQIFVVNRQVEDFLDVLEESKGAGDILGGFVLDPGPGRPGPGWRKMLARSLDPHLGPHFLQVNLGPFAAFALLSGWYAHALSLIPGRGYLGARFGPWVAIDSLMSLAGLVLAFLFLWGALRHRMRQEVVFLPTIAFSLVVAFNVFMLATAWWLYLIKVTLVYLLALIYVNRWRNRTFRNMTGLSL